MITELQSKISYEGNWWIQLLTPSILTIFKCAFTQRQKSHVKISLYGLNKLKELPGYDINMPSKFRRKLLKKEKDKILQFLQPVFPSPLGARANLSWTQNNWQIFQPPLNIMETKSFITVKCQRFTIMHLISSLFCFWKKALYSVKEIRVYFLFIELDSLHLASTSPNMKHK